MTKLAEICTVRELARSRGKGYRSTLRTLLTMNAQLGGRLVWNEGGKGHGARWVLSMNSLRLANEGWFDMVEKDRQIAKLEGELSHLSEALDETRQVVDTQTKSLGELWRVVRKLAA